MAVSLLDVSVATGASGPVLVLTGEADVTSVTRLDKALTAQISGQAVQLTIDATNLRYADSASVTTLGDGGYEGQDPEWKRDAAESAAGGSQDHGLAARRQDCLHPTPSSARDPASPQRGR